MNLRAKRKTLPVVVVLISLYASSATCQTRSLPVAAEFDKIISSEFKPQQPGGVVLVAEKGKVIYKKAFGMADMELNVPMKEEMIFNIGSITKQFTAVAILQLMEQGKLSLQDDLTKYIPDYPVNGQKITIENLLTHTAGIPAPSPEAMTALQGRKNLVSPNELIATFKARPLDFVPGTKMIYSNDGYMLLGAIIEKVSGNSYPDYLEKNLFVPAGMTDTHFGDDYKIIKNRSSSYVYSRAESQFLNAANDKLETAYAAGGIQSTAADLFKWNRALLSNKLLKKESLDKAQTEYKLEGGKRTYYGYGWFTGNIQGSPMVEHGGNMGGFMSHAIYLPKEDVFTVVLYNFRSALLPEYLAGDFAAITIGKPFDLKEVTVDENSLKSYTGVYEEDGVERLITVENGRMFYQRVGGNKLSMKPYAKDKFFFENTAVLGEFKRDQSGKIASLDLVSKRGVSSSVLRRTEKPLPVSH